MRVQFSLGSLIKIINKMQETKTELLVDIMFNTSDKYLLIRAVESRIEELEKLLVNDPNIDHYNTNSDIQRYKQLKVLFSTNLWR